MANGMDDFRVALKEIRGLAVGLLALGTSSPFLAQFLDVMPPKPVSIPIITAVLQVGVFAMTFVLFFRSTRRYASRWLIYFFSAAIFLFFAYMLAFFLFTIQLPNGVTVVTGFQCTRYAAELFVHCPFLTREDILLDRANVETFWTRPSIAVINTSLLVLWFAFFLVLSAGFGSFVSYQISQRSQLNEVVRR